MYMNTYNIVGMLTLLHSPAISYENYIRGIAKGTFGVYDSQERYWWTHNNPDWFVDVMTQVIPVDGAKDRACGLSKL